MDSDTLTTFEFPNSFCLELPDSREVALDIPEPAFLEDASHWDDVDFVLNLAYRGLELEATLADSYTAKRQIAHLLDRLESLDFRK